MTVVVAISPEEVLRRALAAAVPARATVLLGVSGGSDSTALMGLAASVCPARTCVVHVDHGLRPESARDATAVAAAADGLGLACRIVRSPPATPGERSETAARRRRLAALQRLAEQEGAGVVALAHHRDDAVETTLLNLLRGHRGVRALAGIPGWRPLGSGTVLLRPFLLGGAPLDRRELADWRRAAGLPCLEDPMNRVPGIPRNAVRALLAEARAPLTPERVDRLRRRAIGALQDLVADAARRVTGHLRPQGRGAVLERAALASPGRGIGDEPWHAPRARHVEVLRLVGACLARPRRLHLRRAVLERLAAELLRDTGSLSLPADPEPLSARWGPDGLQLPHDALAPGPPAARVLTALARTSLHL